VRVLCVLHVTNRTFEDELKRINKGKLLCPCFSYRVTCPSAMPLIIADGYPHRVCAVCYYDEDAR